MMSEEDQRAVPPYWLGILCNNGTLQRLVSFHNINDVEAKIEDLGLCGSRTEKFLHLVQSDNLLCLELIEGFKREGEQQLTKLEESEEMELARLLTPVENLGSPEDAGFDMEAQNEILDSCLVDGNDARPKDPTSPDHVSEQSDILDQAWRVACGDEDNNLTLRFPTDKIIEKFVELCNDIHKILEEEHQRHAAENTIEDKEAALDDAKANLKLLIDRSQEVIDLLRYVQAPDFHEQNVAPPSDKVTAAPSVHKAEPIRVEVGLRKRSRKQSFGELDYGDQPISVQPNVNRCNIHATVESKEDSGSKKARFSVAHSPMRNVTLTDLSLDMFSGDAKWLHPKGVHHVQVLRQEGAVFCVVVAQPQNGDWFENQRDLVFNINRGAKRRPDIKNMASWPPRDHRGVREKLALFFDKEENQWCHAYVLGNNGEWLYLIHSSKIVRFEENILDSRLKHRLGGCDRNKDYWLAEPCVWQDQRWNSTRLTPGCSMDVEFLGVNQSGLNIVRPWNVQRLG